MSYWIYSSESFPHDKLMGKAGYTPEYLQWAGVQLIVPEKRWFEIQDKWGILRHKDRADKQGHVEYAFATDVVKGLRARFEPRGVIFLDHEPSHAEKKALEAVSLELNLKFRRDAIDFYESQRHDKEVTGTGRTKPTPYEDECYTLLDLEKPYSVEAFKALRRPGEEAAQRIADAIAGALKGAAHAQEATPKPAAAPSR